MEIVGQRFTPKEFADYVFSLHLSRELWKPSFIVLHNTSAPSLAQRPVGFTAAHMQNLKGYYEGLGWHAGPHLFIDDNPKGIWVFSPLNHPGVHSPSWNSVSLGIEQLGEYEHEPYTLGRGRLVRANAIAAIAILSYYCHLDSTSLHLHKQDPKTDHRDCPGRNCANDKANIIKDVHDYIIKNFS